MKIIALLALAVIVGSLAMEATSLVYAGATARAECINAVLDAGPCERGTSARWITNEFFKGDE